MTTLRSVVMLVLAVAGTGMVKAGGVGHEKSEPGPKVAIQKQGEQVRLVYYGHAPVKLTVRITDQTGAEVFAENLRQPDAFVRPYNLSALPGGSYTIEVHDETGSMKGTVEVATGLEPNEVMAHLIRLGPSTERKFLLSVPNQGLGDAVVRIYDDSNLVYEKTVDASSGYAVVYKLRGMEGDAVTFRVDAPDHSAALMSPSTVMP